MAAADAFHILVVSDSFHELPAAIALLEASGHRVSYVRSPRRLREIAPDKVRLAEVDALVTGRVMAVDGEALRLLPRLRVVALHTSGCDNVDLVAATARGVLVTNAKGVNAEPCADHAMGLILASVRQIVRGDAAIRAGRWSAATGVSFDITGATLGVVGLGQIGRALVRRALGFGMNIIVHTRTPDPAFAERHGLRYVSLDALLQDADVVSLTASFTPGSGHLVGERELRLMKPTAFLTNVARGELVDEAALLRALSEGWIAGAGLDVFETEPLLSSPLFGLDNVVLTPHQAGLTVSGKVGAALRAARNALAVLAGEVPADTVNPQASFRNEAV